MEKERIIQQGDVAKFQVTITREDFDQVTDDFFVVLSWGIPKQDLVIEKQDMIKDEDDHFFMVFESREMMGVVTATCHYMVTDSDFPDQRREEIDRQPLAFVVNTPCPKFANKSMCFGMDVKHVIYTRAFRDDVNSIYMNLRTSDKQPVVDSEGRQLRVRKGKKQFY